jgi:hypothetical protein
MYRLKGFFNYSPLVNNNRDQVALLGELSSHSATFAKDKTYHNNDIAPQTTLISFHSVRDEAYVDVPAELAVAALKLGQYLLDRALQGTVTDDAAALRQMVLAEFSEELSGFVTGEMRTNGNIWLPEWIRYRYSYLGEDNEVTIWLSDESFRRQYDEYFVEVIPPFIPLDDFFKDPLQVKIRLDEYNITNKLVEAQQRRGEYPYTQVLALRYDYQDPRDPSWTVPTYWIVLLYGETANNPDLLKNVIVEHVLADSTHTREEWMTILPDLFTTTEYIVTPFWHQYSVPNGELQAGMYSPTVDPRKVQALLRRTARGPKYNDLWVDNNYELSNLLYKSLAFGVVANPENRDGIVRFSEKYPDYMMVSNDSADFDRMSVYTQEFVTKLAQLIKVAENFTDTSSVPAGLAKLKRDGVLYITTVYDNVTYLVVTRKSVAEFTTSELPLPGDTGPGVDQPI